MKFQTGISVSSIALLLTAACFASFSPRANLVAAEPPAVVQVNPSDISLELKYASETVKHQVQRAELAALKMLAEGLEYASSKLCKIDLGKGLEALNSTSRKTIESLSSTITKNRALIDDGVRDLYESHRLATVNPVISKSHRSKAEKGLIELAKQGVEVDKSLTKLQQNLIKTEVLYQRVLAECLLDDFKSIFGAGGTPVPIPEGEDKWPDELWDDGELLPPDFLDID